MAQNSPVNAEKLLEQLDGDQDFFVEMLTEFVEVTGPQLQGLDEAVAAGNHTEVRSLAHSIKGAAGNLCMEKMAEDARVLEFMGRDGNLTGAEEVLGKIKDEFERLTAYVSTLTA